MKKSFLLVLSFVVFAMTLQAQIKTPAASTSASFSQTVGLTDIKVEYSRPSAKGRSIFGAEALVPDGKIWRTGANSVTKITFSDDVMVEGQKLAKGSYGILTVPGASMWDVHFYAYDKSSWNSYIEATPAAKVSVKARNNGSNVESFLIYVDDIENESATLNFAWAKTIVPVKIGVSVDETVMKNIETVLSGPSAGDYYAAASYYYSAGKDLNKALEWVTKATEGPDKKFWQLKMKSEILGKLGKVTEAIETAKMSLDLAKAAGNDDYVKMNTDNINMWTKK